MSSITNRNNNYNNPPPPESNRASSSKSFLAKFKSYVKSQSSSKSNRVEGENDRPIVAIWNEGEDKSAVEIIYRVDTIKEMIKITQKEIEYHESKEKEPHTLNRIVELTNDLAKYEAELTTWASTNYFRDKLRGQKDINSNYSQLVDSYMPIPNNMRLHSIKVEEKIKVGNKEEDKVITHELVRLGIISDMRNGFTNLKQLKELKEQLERKPRDFSGLNKLKETIFVQMEEELKKGHNNVLGAFEYALEEIQNLDSINATIERRKAFLTKQALPLILQHAKSSNLSEIDTLKVLDVRLVNPEAVSIDPNTGFCHHEGNELLDMAEIFKEFSEKKLICDGKGPFIDNDGNIHLPTLLNVDGKPKEINLFAGVVNHNVKWNAKNEGISWDVNKETYARYADSMRKKQGEALNELEDLKNDPKVSPFGLEEKEKKLSANKKAIDKELSRLSPLIFKERTGYSSANKILDFAEEHGFKISTGCSAPKTVEVLPLLLGQSIK